jgi:hypothetical protein
MLLVASGFVLRFGPPFPRWDDLAVLPVVAGERPMTIGWLWAPHSEHRIVLPRLILATSLSRADGDARVVMLLNVALLGGLSAALMLAARSARGGGGARYSDALFPLLLLHLGHGENLTWAIQVAYVLPVCLSGLTLALIVGGRDRPRLRALLAVAILLALLPMTNATGPAMVAGLSPWLVLSGIDRWRSGDRAGGLAILLASIPGVVLTGLYFRGLERGAHSVAAPGVIEVVRTSVQFLAEGLGPAGAILWPTSGVVVVGLLGLSLAVSLRSAILKPDDRLRAFGAIGFLVGIGALAIGTGWGRAGLGASAGLQDRYATLATLGPIGVAAIFERFGPGSSRRLMPMTLLAASCALIWPNTSEGLQAARGLRERSDALLADIRAGLPPYLLIRRHDELLEPSHAALTEHLELMRRADLGPFGDMAPDPPFRTVPLPIEPVSLELCRWDEDTKTITAFGVDPYARFALDETRDVAGIRLRYAHRNPAGEPARFKIAWRRDRQGGWPIDQQHADWGLPTGRGETVVWIGEAIDEFRIQPDNTPCTFVLEQISLLLRDTGTRPGRSVGRP